MDDFQNTELLDHDSPDFDALQALAQGHLAQVDLGDERRNQRLARLLGDLLQRPGKALPEQCGSRAPLKAAYRLLNTPSLSHEQILQSSAAFTLEQIQAQRPTGMLLCIQDTTTLDFSSHHAQQGRGPICDKASTQGYFAHSTLLMSQQGIVHGMLHCEVYARDAGKQKARKPGERNRQASQQKESHRWLRSFEHCAQLCEHLPSVAGIINIADREADMYELFMRAQTLRNEASGKVHLIVRAQHNRQVEGREQRLWAHLRGLPATAGWSVRLPARKGIHGQQERQVEALWQNLRLEAPAHQRKYHGASDPIGINVIMVREPSPPEGQQALEWVLLTTLEVKDAAQAGQIVRWYALRWQIEVMHRIWKSGCRVEERRFRQASAAQAMIVLDLLCAVTLLGWISQARHEPEQDVAGWLTSTQEEVLRARFESEKTRTAGKPLSMSQALRWIAQLGGHSGVPSAAPPGPEALWKGLARLQDLELGWLLAQLPDKCG